MKRLIIPFFLSNKGCRSRCIFCSQSISTGLHPHEITREYFCTTVENHLHSAGNGRRETQVAFYGGNFTGMHEHEQERLLKYAIDFVKSGLVHSVRISTRPDFINEKCLRLLKAHFVKTVEIGGQSMIDDVLERAQRGHTADDIKRAFVHLNDMGFETALHLMIGLPGDTDERFFHSVEEAVRLRPQAVRLHPALVFKDTMLASMYKAGDYHPLSLESAVSLSLRALIRFRQEGIPVIRMGLYTSEEMEKKENLLAGPYHPAFGALVESSLFLEMASALLAKVEPLKSGVTFFVAPSDVSNLRGLNNGNLKLLREKAGDHPLEICEEPGQKKGLLALVCDGNRYTALPSPHGEGIFKINRHTAALR